MPEVKKERMSEAKKDEGLQLQVSAGYQIILIVMSAVAIMIAVYTRISQFHMTDVHPEIQVITPNAYQKFGGVATKVKVGLQIEEFATFNVVGNKFVIDGILWFFFDPGAISLETLENFEFQRGTILYRSEPRVKLVKEKLLVSYNIRVEFSSPMTYVYFPLEDYRIFLTLVHRFVSPNEVLFQSTEQDLVVKADVTRYGWENVGHGVEYGYLTSTLDEYDPQKTRSFPAVTFYADTAQAGVRNVITILLPLLILFYISMFSFSITGVDGPRRVASGSVTATLAYRFVIESLSPKSGYLMLSDWLFILFLGANVVVFFTIIFHLYGRSLSLYVRDVIVVGLYVTVTTLAVLLII